MGSEQIGGSRPEILQVAMQDPASGASSSAGRRATPPAVPPADAKATLEKTQAAENVARQQLTNDVEQWLQKSRALVHENQPEAALNALRLAQNVIRSATSVPEEDRTRLDRRVQAQMLSTALDEERIVGERAEHQRIEAAGEQRTRALDMFQRNKQTIAAMMVQFDTLITEGVYNVLYNGGMGDIRLATAPFTEAKLLAQKANALQRGSPLPYSDNDPSPMAGRFRRNDDGFPFAGIAVSRAQEVPIPANPARRLACRGSVPGHPDDRVSRCRLVAADFRETDQALGQGLSICTSAIPRPSRSSRNSTSRSRCLSPTRPRSTMS